MARRRKKKSNKIIKNIFKKLNISPITYVLIIFFGIYINLMYGTQITNFLNKMVQRSYVSYDIGEVPEYDGKNYYVYINKNEPFFKEEEITTKEFEKYSNLDLFGRCGVAYANVSPKTMPTKERGPIGMIKPSGWHTVKYDIVENKYLYNRCHLIGYQLTGENDNEKNLITCTRYMNSVGMLEFENKVADYVKKTKNHVLYRVTPIFEGNNLLVKGVEMEALSVEDKGRGIKFNVFVYNVQNGITIDYRNGNSKLTK